MRGIVRMKTRAGPIYKKWKKRRNRLKIKDFLTVENLVENVYNLL